MFNINILLIILCSLTAIDAVFGDHDEQTTPAVSSNTIKTVVLETPSGTPYLVINGIKYFRSGAVEFPDGSVGVISRSPPTRRRAQASHSVVRYAHRDLHN